MGKLKGHSSWPCMLCFTESYYNSEYNINVTIDERDDREKFCTRKKKSRTQFYVQFFGEPPSYGWLFESQLTVYSVGAKIAMSKHKELEHAMQMADYYFDKGISEKEGYFLLPRGFKKKKTGKF